MRRQWRVQLWAAVAGAVGASAATIDSTSEYDSCMDNIADCKSLNLANKDLTGTIPTEVGTFTALTSFRLGFNSISGQLPTEVNKLQSLTLLEVAYNKLEGPIPLVDLENLEHLVLAFNSFTGALPSELAKNVNLRTLFVSANHLGGAIPTEIDRIANLTMPGCELTYPLYDIPTNLFTPPFSAELKSKCIIEDPTDAVVHDRHEHFTCGMCMHHRCVLHWTGTCARKWGFQDPSGYQKEHCMCACCGKQCGISHSCTTALLDEPEARATLPPPEGWEPQQSSGWALDTVPLAAAAVVVAGVAAALLGVARSSATAAPSKAMV